MPHTGFPLQEKGLDTVDANRALGLPDDCREYSPVKYILEELGVKSVQLMVGGSAWGYLRGEVFGVWRYYVWLHMLGAHA